MTAPANGAGRRVAVIGGGFCGAFFAAQLAQYSTVPVIIQVVEPRPALGGGVAYSSTDPAHRINVPAARMILFPETPDDFDTWLRRNGEPENDAESVWKDGSLFPRRAAFGRYVGELIATRQATRLHAPIYHIQDRAAAVQRRNSAYAIQLGGGGEVTADIIVIATSHPPPDIPPLLANAMHGDPRLIADPWAPDALADIPATASIVVVGTGLTMADVVASLERRGHAGPVTAFSRRGQLSRGHAASTPATPFTWFDTNEAPHSTRALLQQARALVRAAARDGYPWQAVFDNIRANGQKLWQTLDEPERRRFLRHLRVYWDTHRYRVAPQIEAAVQRKRQDGTLRVLAASLRAVEPDLEQITLALQPRHKGPEHLTRVVADRIVVTTGPNHGSVITHNAVLESLAAQGLIKPDPLGLGLAVNGAGQAMRADGTNAPDMFVVGPLAREQYGELMGLPQVAAQPDAVAKHLAAALKIPASVMAA